MQIRRIAFIFLINALLVLILYSYLYYSHLGEFPLYSDDWTRFVFLIFASNVIGFGVFLLNKLLNRLSFWRYKIGLRFILGIGINYLTIIILLLLGIWIYLQLVNLNFSIKTLLEEYNEIKIRLYILVLVLVILYVVFDFLIYSYKYYSQGQLQNARLRRKQMELQFEALRTQLSPHYLFNSLNTISALVYKDIDQTEEYIRKLAGTYQYILESDKKQLIALGEEMDFIRDYCYLLNIRFGKAFVAHIQVDKLMNACLIPPVSIQILVENAVKHNVFDDENPLEVHIVARDQIVSVKNRILKLPASRESFQIGLSNIRKRYEVFTDKKIKIKTDGHFKVELPLLKPKSNA